MSRLSLAWSMSTVAYCAEEISNQDDQLPAPLALVERFEKYHLSCLVFDRELAGLLEGFLRNLVKVEGVT